MKLAEALDGFVLVTEHLYSPPAFAVRLCTYVAVELFTNTVSVPTMIATLSLVQVTVVAGDTGEGELRIWSIEVRVYCQCQFFRDCNSSYKIHHYYNMPKLQ